MPSTLPGRKRKAAEQPKHSDSDSDSEHILVACPMSGSPPRSKSTTNATSTRAPLEEVPSNKRQRTLKYVRIPRYEASLSDAAATTPRHEGSQSSPSAEEATVDPSAKHSGEGPRPKKAKTSGFAQSSLSAFLRGPAVKSSPENRGSAVKVTGSQPRPRRSTTGVSYAKELALESGSDDEPLRSAKRVNCGVKAQRKNDDDDDGEYGAEEQSSSAEELELEDAEVVQSDDESSDVVSDASVEDEQPRPAKGKASKAVNAGKAATQGSPLPRSTDAASTKAKSGMLNLNRKGPVKGLDLSLPLLSETSQIFEDMTSKALTLGLGKATKRLAGTPLRIATMCSGTESPLLALQMIRDALEQAGAGAGAETITVEHVFSAEIVPFKQAYIERNFAPPIIFRDITEFTAAFESDEPMATTAYGARVSIPRADIVVAGTSCVDYSRQNAHRKGIADGGESGKTWYGALAYCKAIRPKIIIFENVQSADWASMLKHYRAIDYDCEGVFVDSKDYYIPHTRQRGYMVCFDTRGLGEKSSSSVGLGKRWQELMEKLKRRASSSVSDFLLPADQVVVRQHTRDDEAVREVDWAQCEIRQMQYRQSQGLGIARPVTHWLESGFMIVPERGLRAWFTRQVERVKDTIDCCILRTAVKSMYDPRYKTCIWDLSQNIERVHDASRGITGCILPTGIFFVSDANRILAAEETLMLQGIPLDRISFTTETQAELLDFAGNAMTSRVVGSALLAALIVGHELIDPNTSLSRVTLPGSERNTPASIAQPSADTAETFTYRAGAGAGAGELDVKDILVLADRAARRCYCESSDMLCAKPLQECVDCHHTICITCGGDPVHSYHHLSNDNRLQPASFTAQLKAHFPHQLTFQGSIPDLRAASGSASASNGGTANLKRYQKVVEGIQGAVYSFESIRRTHCWTVSYAAPKARLDLSITHGCAEWRLFATPEQSLAANDWLRTTLQQPVAQAIVSHSLFDVDWQWRVPSKHSLSLRMRGAGADIPSWWARIELPAHLQDTQPQLLEIMTTEADASALERSLSGTYRYLPKCGKAADSLYCKIDEEQSNNERPIFLFWDPRPVGDSEEDVFVFSYNKSHLEKDEVRSILAHAEAPWRPWPTKGKAVAPKIMTDGTWVAAPEFQLQAQDVNLMMQRSLSATTEYDQCDQAKHILGCHVQQQAEGIKMTAGVIDVTKDVAFISGHIWLFEVMQRQIDLNVWHALPSDAVSGACLACAPPKPQLQWKLNTDRKSLKAYEDVSTANEYERAVKSRAEPIVVTAAADDHSYTVDFGVNVMSLAHRAAARLPSGSHGVAARWKLDTSNGLGVLASPKFKLLDTSGQPSDVQLGMNVELFPNQRLVLAWMQKQELGVEFFVEEAEEAVAKAIGWRAEVRVSAPLNVRGGICADHPGFGKTITSLALIQAQYLGADVSDRLTARRDKNAPGLLVSSATLIVCPATLTQQWLNEIKDKIGSISGVLTVFKIADLARYSITDFQNAKIILVNRSILGSEPYAEKLAVLAAVPGPAVKTGGRAFAQWLRYATQRVPEHLRVLQDAGRDALKQHIRTKYRERVESAQAGSGAASVPSRRLRGKDYVAAKGKQTGSKAQADRAAPATVDTKEVDRPLFEMFYFNRLIVDEFHQYDSREFAAITALKADKRWGLSGTPALDDLYDVAQLASMVGVPLRSGIDAKGVMKARNIKALRADMTDFERFEAMRSLPSSAMHARLCEVHQLFLDTFVRRNLMDFAEMRYEDNLRPVTLDLDHRVMYTELSQHLNSLDMRIKRGKKAQATDRDERLYRAVNTSETAEEALSKTAAFLDRDTFEASSGLEAAIHIREAQVTDTKKKLRRAITEAEQGESDNLRKWKWTCLENGSLQDEETIASIDGLPKLPRDLAGASKGKRKRSNESDEGLDEVEGPTKPTGANPLTSQVNTLSKRLVVAYRSLRYLHSVQRLQQHVTEHQARLPRCQAMNCDTLTPSVDLAVSAYCGHIVCKDCYKSLDEIHSTQCSAKGCCCSMQSYHLLWTSKMGDLRSINPTPYGTKLMKVVSILREIRRKDEQAVLFVQYAEQMREVERALEGQGVPSLLITDAGKAAAQIKSFQENTRYTALVLNASDETAAGLNLQNANHVIFVSPLLRDSQYTYEATMAQAIGRVRRHGQKKQIFVHRVVALDTIDVDILEHRERRTDAITEPAAPSFTFPAPRTAGVQLEANGKPKRERCQLVKVEGRYSMQPHSWLCDGEGADGEARVKGRSRVSGWEDFSSQLKFSRAYTEDDE